MRLVDLDDERHTYIGSNGEYERWSIDPEVPAIQPRKKGKWKKGVGENGVTTSLFCSECNYENTHWYDWNYCPNCGADLRGDKNVDE